MHALGLLPGTVDTGMQVSIRASGINRVSQLPRSALASPLVPARAIVALCRGEAGRYAGTEVDVRDPAVAALLLGA